MGLRQHHRLDGQALGKADLVSTQIIFDIVGSDLLFKHMLDRHFASDRRVKIGHDIGKRTVLGHLLSGNNLGQPAEPGKKVPRRRQAFLPKVTSSPCT